MGKQKQKEDIKIAVKADFKTLLTILSKAKKKSYPDTQAPKQPKAKG